MLVKVEADQTVIAGAGDELVPRSRCGDGMRRGSQLTELVQPARAVDAIHRSRSCDAQKARAGLQQLERRLWARPAPDHVAEGADFDEQPVAGDHDAAVARRK